MRKKWLIIGTLAILAVLAVALWLLFFRDDAPEAVSTEAGLEQLQQDLVPTDETDPRPTAETEPETGPEIEPETETTVEQNLVSTAGTAALDASINGTWIVDDDFGDFDFETASGSFAGFRVDEVLTVGDVIAVGRSGGVTGSLTIEDGVLVTAEIIVDMTTIVSNDRRRENAIRGAVNARDFPTAEFVLTEPTALDVEALAAGSTVFVDAVGNLTVKGVTNRVVFSLEATIADAGVGLIIGSTEIFWEDFDVTPPRAPIVVSVEDYGVVEFQLIVRPG